MKTKILLLLIGVLGFLVSGWGISTLVRYQRFTETTEGVVARREGNEVIIRFHEERSSPAPQEMRFSGDAEYAFPAGDRTEHLKVGDRVEAYHPPGRLSEVRLDRDFSYLWPVTLTAAGAVLIVAAGSILVLSGRKKSL